MKNVTEKNTKSYILAAYKELFEKYNDLVKDRVPVKDQVRDQEKRDLYSKVEDTPSKSVTSAFQDLLKKAEHVDAQMTNAEALFSTVSKAVEHKEKELKDLFGIESGCHSLIALKEAQKAETLKFREEQENDQKDHKRKLEDFERELKDLQLVYEKKEEELTYNYNRKRLEQSYELDMEKKKQLLVINDEMKILENAKKEFQDEKEAFKVIKDEFEENSKAIIEKEKENGKKAVEMVKKHYAYEKEISSSKYEAEIEKRDFEVTLLKTKVGDLQSENQGLSDKLKEAYEKLQELAKETVHSKGKDEIIEKLSSIAKKQNSNN